MPDHVGVIQAHKNSWRCQRLAEIFQLLSEMCLKIIVAVRSCRYAEPLHAYMCIYKPCGRVGHLIFFFDWHFLLAALGADHGIGCN